MPFNGSGTFSIVNTFIPNTTILSSAVNQNFSDIATGLSDCLTRDGQAGMTAALGLISGTSSAPSLTFNSDAASGLYSPASGAVALVANALGLKVNSRTYGAISAAIQAGGSNYAVNDTIYLTGGTAVVAAAFTVSSVSAGAVTGVTMTVPGIYTATPSNPVAQGSTSGAGSGCTLNVTWNNLSTPVYNLGITDLSDALLWTKFGSSSFVAGLMGKANGLDFATGIGAANLAAAISTSFTITPQGYLTPTSNTPLILSDVTAATSIYYTPYVGNMIPIYNGTGLVNKTFSQLQCTLTAGAQASGGIYDVYAFLNSGSVTLGFSPSWSAGTSGSVTAGSCARGTGSGGTALTRVSGIYTNAAAMTLNNGATTYNIGVSLGTLLGSIYVNSTAGQLNFYRSWGQSRAWGISNAYNAAPLALQCGDSTASWFYNSGTIRNSNGSSANTIASFTCLPGQVIYSTFKQAVQSTTGGGLEEVYIGVNSSTVASGFTWPYADPTGGSGSLGTTFAEYSAVLTLGLNNINCLENTSTLGSGSQKFFGGTGMLLNVEYLG